MAETARACAPPRPAVGPRRTAAGLLARAVERAYLALNPPRPCRRRLSTDLFDGRAWPAIVSRLTSYSP